MTTEAAAKAIARSDFDDHVCYCSGHWNPYRDLRISVDDVGFRQGVVAVERLRTYCQHPFRVGDHLDRWQHTTSFLQIDGLPNLDQIDRLIMELIGRNRKLVDQQTDVGITIFASPGQTAAQPTFVAHLNRLDHPTINRRRQSGQPLVLTRVEQPSEHCWPRSIKVRSRLHYYLADSEARKQSSDAIGVLVDHDGNVTETSIANLAIVESGQIMSPPSETVLGGITQMVTEQVAADIGISWRKRPITPTDLSQAEEVLLMGTDGGVWFACSVDGQQICTQTENRIFDRLVDSFRERTSIRSNLPNR